jgi:hypothetical protein
MTGGNEFLTKESTSKLHPQERQQRETTRSKRKTWPLRQDRLAPYCATASTEMVSSDEQRCISHRARSLWVYPRTAQRVRIGQDSLIAIKMVSHFVGPDERGIERQLSKATVNIASLKSQIVSQHYSLGPPT